MKKQDTAISYCITCRNRLHHLAETFPHNFATQVPYIRQGLRVQFVIVDYGSEDTLEQWMINMKMADPGHVTHVKYVKVLDNVDHWYPSHAKNIAHKAADGDILVSLDADNFLLKSFTSFIISNFVSSHPTTDNGRFLAPAEDDFYGRLVYTKHDFEMLGGYDERLRYGASFEDTDLFIRSKSYGLEHIIIPEDHRVAIITPEKTRAKHAQCQSVQMVTAKHQHMINTRTTDVANENKAWGQATVSINFEKEVKL